MSARPTLQTAERGSRFKDQLWSISHYTAAIRGRPPLRKQDYDSLIALITFISTYMCNSLDFLFGLLAYTRKLVVSVGPCLNWKMQYSFLQNQMNGKVPENAFMRSVFLQNYQNTFFLHTWFSGIETTKMLLSKLVFNRIEFYPFKK